MIIIIGSKNACYSCEAVLCEERQGAVLSLQVEYPLVWKQKLNHFQNSVKCLCWLIWTRYFSPSLPPLQPKSSPLIAYFKFWSILIENPNKLKCTRGSISWVCRKFPVWMTQILGFLGKKTRPSLSWQLNPRSPTRLPFRELMGIWILSSSTILSKFSLSFSPSS